MLVTVIVAFLVFSFTGVAVLDVAYNSRSAAIETTKNIQLQYEMESTINEALWLINAGDDTLVNYTKDGISCSWDTLTNVLTVNVEKFDMESEVILDLSLDTHFSHTLAARSSIQTNGYSTDGVRTRQFTFLPEIDMDYFYNNVVQIHGGNDHSWKDDYLNTEGIHIFTGNNLSLDSISINNSTLIFTGRGITFTGANTISAGTPIDTDSVLPALVFTNPDANFTIEAGNEIKGAIYCAGQINIGSSVLSGPVIADNIALEGDVTFQNDEHREYYSWALGFDGENSYDWPKHIGRWNVSSWSKNINS